MSNTNCLPNVAFNIKLGSCIFPGAEYLEHAFFLRSKLTAEAEQGVAELKLWTPLPTGGENYHYLQEMWKQEQKSSSRDFWPSYKSLKHLISTLEAMQKLNAFYRNKNFHTLKVDFMLLKLANICPHVSTDAKNSVF